MKLTVWAVRLHTWEKTNAFTKQPFEVGSSGAKYALSARFQVWEAGRILSARTTRAGRTRSRVSRGIPLGLRAPWGAGTTAACGQRESS